MCINPIIWIVFPGQIVASNIANKMSCRTPMHVNPSCSLMLSYDGLFASVDDAMIIMTLVAIQHLHTAAVSNEWLLPILLSNAKPNFAVLEPLTML